MVKDKKLEGIQIHADGAWVSDIAKAYQVKSIPTFVLIDGKGIIISPYAPRPSSSEIRKLIDESMMKL
jgi:thioredoxin-related protein